MEINKLTIFLLVPLCVAAFSFSPVYSADPAGKPSLMEKVRNAEKAMEKNYPRKHIEDPLPVVEQCSEKYEECIEKCADLTEGFDECENKCKEELSLCEKDLPKEWKTIK
jgi:hypothetical protein